MFKTIAAFVAVGIAAVLIFASTRPDSFHVERSTLIKAPPDKIFGLINDFHRWTAWSPWEGLDPAMQRTHSGAAQGVGAAYAWQGNSKVGAGRMQITESGLPNKISIRLDFIQPFEAHNTAEFSLQPEGDATRVTWAMNGPSPYISKLMGVFVSIDSMIGKDFAAGLAKLKAAAEQ